MKGHLGVTTRQSLKSVFPEETMFKKLLIAFFLLAIATQASAGVKTFAVLPFGVHGPQEYQYLSQGIQSMLTSRLSAPGRLAALDSGMIKKAAATLPTDTTGAAKIRSALGVDYLVWGSMTVMGTECSLDINRLDDSGENQPYPIQTNLDQVIPSLENVATAMSGQILGTAAPMATAPTQAVKPMNQALIVNETDGNTAYANPSLKYQDADASMGRWRSQMLPVASRGMVVCDGDGDGKNEIFMLTDSALMAFRVTNGQMSTVSELELPRGRNYLRLNSIDLNRDGRDELIVSAVLGKDPRSLVIAFENNRLAVRTDNIPLHLGVINLPPTFMPTLVGQKIGRIKYLDSKIHHVTKMNDKYELGPAVDLPQGGTVYNVTFLPTGDGHQVILIDDLDHMRVFSSTGALLTTTEETYAGSNLGVDFFETAAGLQAERSNTAAMSRVFIPLRGIVADLDRNKRHELLISRNVSVSAQIFSNYRDYPQGEIHSLYWDEVGMSLEWKTARIKGTVTDYCLADLDNDGSMDLVVSLNSHTGMMGTAKKRAMLIAYPLDTPQSGGQKN